MAKNDWRKKLEEAGGKTISVMLTPEASLALEGLKKRLKSSQADIVSRVLIWGLSEVEAGKKPSSDRGSATQEDSSRATHESSISSELEVRLQAIEERLAKLEPKARSDFSISHGDVWRDVACPESFVNSADDPAHGLGLGRVLVLERNP